ncbi:MAG TPA: hypothetical protein VIK86_04425 [Candidatus Paceibacterota bacterium]
MSEKNKKYENLINFGANLAGSAIGTALAFLIAGVPVAILYSRWSINEL